MPRTKLYTMDVLNNLNLPVRVFDIFFLAQGSDERAYKNLTILKENNVEIKRLVAFNFEERLEVLDILLKEKYELVNRIDYEKTFINCSIKDVSKCLKNYTNWDVELSKDMTIGIDISCFTKPYFFSIIKFLQLQFGIKEIWVFYTEPNTYYFSKGIHHRTYHSGSGELSIIEIPGYSGNNSRKKNNILIILLGFDGELASFINREEISPGITIVINGFPSYVPKFKDISLINNEKLLRGLDSNRNLYFSTANNPFETFAALEEISNNFPDSFINIAPLGTKPMALGACIFGLFHPDSRIIYPLPFEYKEKTTSDCWNSWYYKIPLVD